MNAKSLFSRIMLLRVEIRFHLKTALKSNYAFGNAIF